MLPKVQFRYSKPYDWHNKQFVELLNKKNPPKFASPEKVVKFMHNLGKEWSKIDKKVLPAIEKATKLKWKENIIGYVVTAGRAYSEPLTIVYDKSMRETVEVLTHEIIHNIFSQNSTKTIPSFMVMVKKYSHLPAPDARHLTILAVHAVVAEQVFGKKRKNQVVKQWMDHPKGYHKGWATVLEVGPENIIKEAIQYYTK